jgi:DNA polymerase I-like protein with 3'-5' exonuclease and polymerase domains
MIVLDLETTANGGPDKDSPDAHWRCNRVLLAGWIENGAYYESTHLASIGKDIEQEILDIGECLLVAHNAKFDIKYLMRDLPHLAWERVRVWDTMTWEYLQSGHRTVMASLEDTATRYGIKFKKSLNLGALIASGVKMEDIPHEDLAPYLEEDVHVLHKIYLEQRKQGTHWMDHILPLAEMELNGLPLNIDKASKLVTKLQKELDESYEYIRDHIMRTCVWQDGTSPTLDDFSEHVYPKSKYIKATANRTISMLLTGEPAVLSITPKWKLSLTGAPLVDGEDIWEEEPTNLGYPMGEEHLDRINEELGNNCELIDHVLRHRKNTKIVNTYLLPMIRQALCEGTVHPNLNTAVTVSGRLSSTSPNGQNMPPIVRELIEADEIEEVDFSQLEVVGAATLSGDKQLIYDLQHGVDIHKNTATTVFGPSLAEEKRKLAKNVNFGVLYGGKAYGLSKQTGVDKETIQELIDAFYTSYPGVATWQRSLFENIVDNMEACYASMYTLPTSGRRFQFVETEAPDWVKKKTHRSFSFSPNHTANYPIQGFAGGDIVMYGLWWLWTQVRTEADFLLTVHDSILIKKDRGTDLSPYYLSMNQEIEKKFNLPVNLHVDVETGQQWR